MDEIDLFPRMPDGPNPFLLLDGHGSRFELPFMEYINQPETMWFVCIGVPYGTSYWQVGDSPEQNGCFKMKKTEAKEILVAWKASRGWEITIEKLTSYLLSTTGGSAPLQGLAPTKRPLRLEARTHSTGCS